MSFGDLPFGITVTFLNKILFDTRILSSLFKLLNSRGNNVIYSFLDAAWHGMKFFLNFLSQVLQMYKKPSYDSISKNNWKSKSHFSCLKCKTNLWYKQQLQAMHSLYGPYWISFLKPKTCCLPWAHLSRFFLSCFFLSFKCSYYKVTCSCFGIFSCSGVPANFNDIFLLLLSFSFPELHVLVCIRVLHISLFYFYGLGEHFSGNSIFLFIL